MSHKARVTGTIFGIERYAIHDGPGIRTLVFLKGCPLQCPWCQNPEGLDPKPQLAFFPDKCIECWRCIDTCPYNAMVRAKRGRVKILRKRCKVSGKCVETCPSEALKLIGKTVSAEDVFKEAVKDLPFYRNSGGGVTLTGGEPLMQPDFAAEVLKLCKEKGIHTAIETSGYTSWENIGKVLPFTDLFLYDIKHLAPSKHKELVGASNELILGNAERISEMDKPMVIRIPVIPGFNDSDDNMRATAEFAARLKSVERIELLPYHNLGEPKYKRLGLRYDLKGLIPPSREHMMRTCRLAEASGVRCVIV